MNCYEVIGENDAKTEGTLRARFERASSCSPCILLLRNIDAFAQTTHGMEPGKGDLSLSLSPLQLIIIQSLSPPSNRRSVWLLRMTSNIAKTIARQQEKYEMQTPGSQIRTNRHPHSQNCGRVLLRSSPATPCYCCAVHETVKIRCGC